MGPGFRFIRRPIWTQDLNRDPRLPIHGMI